MVRIILLWHGNNDSISYAYDIFDRVTRQQYNDGTTYNYIYNAEGALAEQYVTGGSRYNFEYDSLGRLLRSRETDSTGAVIQRTQHSYDNANRLVYQSWQIGSDNYSESYSYDDTDGTLSSMNTATGAKITLDYDNLKRLETEKSEIGTEELYTKSYSYRDSVNPDTPNRTTLQVSSLSYSGRSDFLPQYNYTYNALGDIVSVEEVYFIDNDNNNVSITTSYSYDNRQQLIEANIGSDYYSYTYDTAGNILTASSPFGFYRFTYEDADWVDLLTSYTIGNDTINIQYDDIGNPTEYNIENSCIMSMTWEKGRQLRQLTKGSTTTTYTYDMNGIRSSKTVNGTTTSFITQNGLVVRQTTGNQVIDFFYDSQQRPYAMQVGDNIYYYLLNLQGDVEKLINSSGSIVAAYSYDPWGGIIASVTTEASALNNLADLNPLRYRGYYYDTESGFYYLQSRYYDPNIGRFINADAAEYSTLSVQNLSDTNLFVYCRNNPIQHDDQDGKWIHLVVGAVVGGIIGGVSAAISSQAEYGEVDPVHVLIGVGAGVLGGLLTASGAGMVAEVAGSAAIAALQSSATQARDISVHGKEWSWSKLVEDTSIGAVAGLAGGRGASYGNSKHITNLGSQAISRVTRGDSVLKTALYYVKSANPTKNVSVLTNMGKSFLKGYAINRAFSLLK